MKKSNESVSAFTPELNDPSSPEYYIRVINELGTMLATIYDRRTGLTRNQTRIIISLLENDGQTQTELANDLGIHKVSVGIYVSELEGMDLVERRNHPTDGRAKCIYLTPRLHATKHIGRNEYTRIHNAAISGINQNDYLTMVKCMERMKENLVQLDESDRKNLRRQPTGGSI